MKKRNLFITIALVIVISFTALACANIGGVKVKVVGEQDQTYIVLSNGGSAVQYGNYVYFINGYKGYADEDAKQNVFNDVEKGAIYRAELYGESASNKSFSLPSGNTTQKSWEIKRDAKTLLSIKTTTNHILKGYEVDESGEYLTDEDGEYLEIRKDVEYADVQLIAPKVVGTVGNKDGGIFIFDGYVFYASPSNKKDNKGIVQTTKTEFYRTKLDGTETNLIYTTASDSTDSPYMFYKYNGAHYLVVLDGTNAVSVKMDKKIRDAKIFAKDVSELYLPNKGVYYNGMPENTVEDFVYVLRSPINTDPYRIGNVLEMRRPDGEFSNDEHGKIISANGRTSTIIGSDNGTFFYMVNDVVKYSNYSSIINDNANDRNINGEFDFSMESRYTAYRPFHPNSQNNDDVYLVATNVEGLHLVDRLGNQTTLYNDTCTIVDIKDGYVYFTSAVTDKTSGTYNMLMRINPFAGGIEVLLNTDSVSDSPTFKYDILPDFVVYFADIDSQAPTYAFFKEIDRLVAYEDLTVLAANEIVNGDFIGYRIAGETTPEEDLHPEEDEE